MTKEKAKELSDVLKAYSEGKIIEVSNNGNQWAELNMSYPDAIFKYNQHRIKPKPKLVPFTFEDNLLFRDKWIRLKGKKPLCKFDNITEYGVKNNLGVASYSELFKNYEFEDGSPCGKYVNE